MVEKQALKYAIEYLNKYKQIITTRTELIKIKQVIEVLDSIYYKIK